MSPEKVSFFDFYVNQLKSKKFSEDVRNAYAAHYMLIEDFLDRKKLEILDNLDKVKTYSDYFKSNGTSDFKRTINQITKENTSRLNKSIFDRHVKIINRAIVKIQSLIRQNETDIEVYVRSAEILKRRIERLNQWIEKL